MADILSLKNGPAKVASSFHVYTLGYEPRCVNAAQKAERSRTSRACAFGFTHSKVLAYEENRVAFARLGVDVIDDVSESDYAKAIRRCLDDAGSPDSITVDISSMPRDRIAAWVDVLFEQKTKVTTFVYSPARFSRPANHLVQNERIGPVSPTFAGVWLDSSLSSELVVGLGYELGKALGAVEYLQCREPWLFVPHGSDERFESEVVRVNNLLLRDATPNKVVRYSLTDPAGTYADLFSLVRGLSTRANPILLPLGPKLFALIAMLAGRRFSNTAVWRASQGLNEDPSPREAEGLVVSLTAEFT